MQGKPKEQYNRADAIQNLSELTVRSFLASQAALLLLRQKGIATESQIDTALGIVKGPSRDAIEILFDEPSRSQPRN